MWRELPMLLEKRLSNLLPRLHDDGCVSFSRFCRWHYYECRLSDSKRLCSPFRWCFAKETAEKSSKTITTLSASGAIDFFGSGQTGFLYAAPSNCLQCGGFELRLLDAIKEKSAFGQVYKYSYPIDPTEFDKFAHEATIADEKGPVLLYVRDGRIYDRLDETNGDLAVATFLAKYKK